MKEVARIINEANISKVSVAKYLGVSRQMLYNYLAFDSISELPKEKQTKILDLFGVSNENDLKKIKVNDDFITLIETRINEGIIDSFNKESIADLKGLNKKEQTILTDIFLFLKEKLIENKSEDEYNTLRYLYVYLQNMEQMPELKYILAYIAKSSGHTPVMEYAFDEEKQYIFEGILFSAMSLYTNGGASKAKVSTSHEKWEREIDAKKEEQLSRTQELNTFKTQALTELGYSSINENNAKEVFEKIAEIMSRKF